MQRFDPFTLRHFIGLKNLNLYLISQDHNSGWDTYDSAVVAANTYEEARHIHPSYFVEDKQWWENDNTRNHDSWTHPNKVTVELIGTTNNYSKPTVILASFNAG